MSDIELNNGSVVVVVVVIVVVSILRFVITCSCSELLLFSHVVLEAKDANNDRNRTGKNKD